LRIPIDADRLYTTDDPLYLAWVRAVVNRTIAAYRSAQEK